MTLTFPLHVWCICVIREQLQHYWMKTPLDAKGWCPATLKISPRGVTDRSLQGNCAGATCPVQIFFKSFYFIPFSQNIIHEPHPIMNLITPIVNFLGQELFGALLYRNKPCGLTFFYLCFENVSSLILLKLAKKCPEIPTILLND